MDARQLSGPCVYTVLSYHPWMLATRWPGGASEFEGSPMGWGLSYADCPQLSCISGDLWGGGIDTLRTAIGRAGLCQ